MSNKRYCSKYRFIKNKLKDKLPTNININKNGELITCDNESGSGKLGTENTLRSINVSFSANVHSISSRSTPTGSSGVFPNHDQHTELLQTILKTQIEIKLQTTTFVDKLPINNLSEIDEIEDLIKNEEIFNELVNFLYLVGGENYVRMVNSVMKKLLRHEVAVKFSGVRKTQKLPFCNLKIYKAVHMAIRKRHNSTTDQEIQKTVSLYLAQSKARLSSSKTRRFLDNQEKV
ncbi:hypothetical protein RN001_015832 [Aquatica leii]|uniref:DUF4806 domain-containing protein n=1 Tax=Aquatica leii TaxID=1421715 RepID=A0AAN7SK41_9COLE|nr:hypothetical protein RN001_015832 [Aquatica leii]